MTQDVDLKCNDLNFVYFFAVVKQHDTLGHDITLA